MGTKFEMCGLRAILEGTVNCQKDKLIRKCTTTLCLTMVLASQRMNKNFLSNACFFVVPLECYGATFGILKIQNNT